MVCLEVCRKKEDPNIRKLGRAGTATLSVGVKIDLERILWIREKRAFDVKNCAIWCQRLSLAGVVVWEAEVDIDMVFTNGG